MNILVKQDLFKQNPSNHSGREQISTYPLPLGRAKLLWDLSVQTIQREDVTGRKMGPVLQPWGTVSLKVVSAPFRHLMRQNLP